MQLTVDVTPLENGQSLRVEDVSVPGALILERPREMLALVAIAKVKPEEAAPAAETPAAAATPAPTAG